MNSIESGLGLGFGVDRLVMAGCAMPFEQSARKRNRKKIVPSFAMFVFWETVVGGRINEGNNGQWGPC